MTFHCISSDEAAELMTDDHIILADIRDQTSFRQGRIGNACELNNSTVGDFLATHDKSAPVIVYCYHGHSSQGAAKFLSEQGFTTVYSLDGGYEEWKQQHPVNHD